MAADPAAAAAASAVAAISAVMDWRSSPDARAAAFAYLESVRAPPFPARHLPHPLWASSPRVCFWFALACGTAVLCRALGWLMPALSWLDFCLIRELLFHGLCGLICEMLKWLWHYSAFCSAT